MSFFNNPFKGRQPGGAAPPTPPTSQPGIPQPPPAQQSSQNPSGPNTGPLPGSTVQTVQSGNVTLVTYSPEELLQRVEQRRNSVSFGLSGTAKFMDNFNQVWSWAGPVLFALGTIGEIFIVLWERQRAKDWFTGSTIIA